MSADIIVRVIVIVAAVTLVSIFLIAGRLFPDLTGKDSQNLAAAVPLIAGLAVMAPIALKMILKK